MNSSRKSVFVAYPASPAIVGDAIKRAIEIANGKNKHFEFSSWEENDIAGRPLIAPILSNIESSPLLIADISTLNFNVTFEIGFSIGAHKRVYLVRNEGTDEQTRLLNRIGIFDTLGYDLYENGDDLSIILAQNFDLTPIATNVPQDRKAPVYVVETPKRSEAIVHMIARLKKTRLQYRSFIPQEDVRMAAMEAIQHVAASHGVLVPLLPNRMPDHDIHNIRAAFVAGLAHGMGKPALILQEFDGPVPLDIRDFAKSYKHPSDIDDHIHTFALDVVQSMQVAGDTAVVPGASFLEQLSIGDPMAENEFQTLEKYYLRTDQFTRVLRGEVNLVVGRKGAGKTALFSQVRNQTRRDTKTIVVDLKPEGYQLVKLKEEVLDFLSEGAKYHLIVAFWEYLLLLEICYKLLEKDAQLHLRDHDLYENYQKIKELYLSAPNVSEGDFSERLLQLSNHLGQEYRTRFKGKGGVRLTNDDVTELMHTHYIKTLRGHVSSYLTYKNAVWVLFDNLDKGWSGSGPSETEILILRCLIEASRKVQRDLQKDGHDFHSIVFIRNDVYQLLMDESPDFGKEMKASLDWGDPDLLREILRRRLVQNGLDEMTEFQTIWNQVCISHYKTEDSSQFLIDRSLMRPRNVLKLFNHWRGFAVNFGHAKIGPDDIEKGTASYSSDLVIEADQELSSIDRAASGLIYRFFREDWIFTKEELAIFLDENKIPSDLHDKIIHFLLYFGFLGIALPGQDPQYIYDVNYDVNFLSVLTTRHAQVVKYALNPAFWSALQVGPTA